MEVVVQKIIFQLFHYIWKGVKKQIANIEKHSDSWHPIEVELRKIESETQTPKTNIEGSIKEFTKRVSYLFLTKLILSKMLEDNGLVEKDLLKAEFESLSNPSFFTTLSTIFHQIGLTETFFYPYLHKDSVYNLEIKNKEATTYLAELSNFHFTHIPFDTIGTLYEHYLEIDHRKKKGQYYTPHYLVKFILNRIGFTGKSNHTLWDPSAGSGGFIIEAAKKFRDNGIHPPKQTLEYMIQNLYATEITPFPVFICKLNWFIQIIPLYLQLNKNSLKIENSNSPTFLQKDSLLECSGDGGNRESIPYKDFDFVVGNPPYLGESGHKEIFRSIKEHPYWKQYYLGKSDYLYYFIILGLSKLKEGGRLGFITTQYWITADGAKNLRKYILEHSKIIEIIDFRGIKLFPEAKGQENIVFILEKCKHAEPRKNNKIKIVHFKKDWLASQPSKNKEGEITTSSLELWKGLLTEQESLEELLDPNHTNRNWKQYLKEEIVDVYYSAVLQGELTEEAWHIYKKDKVRIGNSRSIVPLEELCNTNQGVVPGPLDAAKIFQKLSEETIHSYNISPKEGVFVLSQQEVETKKIERDILKPFYKSSCIQKGFIDFQTESFLIYTPDIENIEDYPNFKNHIIRYKEYLETRREVVQRKIRWFDLWWAREKSLFYNEKIMIGYRTLSNSFAYTNYPFHSATDTYYINKKIGTKVSLKYLFAVLISNFILDWLKNGNCKIKGNALELFTSSISKIPIKNIDFNNFEEFQIHKRLAGDYSLEAEEGYNYHKTTNTWVKEYGLVDYYMDSIAEKKKDISFLQKAIDSLVERLYL